MWITGKRIGNAWMQTQKFIKSTYHEGRKWANMIDGYASLFRKGLSAAAPMLQDLGAGDALGSGGQGFTVLRYGSETSDGRRRKG